MSLPADLVGLNDTRQPIAVPTPPAARDVAKAPRPSTFVRTGATQAPMRLWYERSKRAVDIVLAVSALVALSPLLVGVALLIKLADFGPVCFAQTRVGRGGRHFRCYKFRSMVPNAEAMKEQVKDMNHHGDGVTFKIPRDPRLTRIGRLLRKTSIDELPQLWNVLRGEMSIVGPRPPVPSEVAQYSLRHLRRLEVVPGLTCIWQVSGRSDVAFERQVEMDLYYVDNRGLWLDLKLIALTIPAVISAKGAY